MTNIEQSLGLFRACRRNFSASRFRDSYLQTTTVNSNCVLPHEDFAAFAKLLTRCWGQLSTDPKDKIYGLLGLGSQTLCAHIRPQYSIDTSVVFRNLAETILQESRSLFLLSHTIKYWFEDEAVRDGVESWLPRWIAHESFDLEYEQAKHRLRQEMLFCACGPFMTEHIGFENGNLRVNGIVILVL